jgi:asparaginyl-tRNA synthetase
MGRDFFVGGKMKLDVRQIYQDIDKYMDKDIVVQGWIRNHRKQKEFGFIDFFDGTHFNTIQIVYNDSLDDFGLISKYRVGSAITVEGKMVKSPKEQQPFEIVVKKIKLEGDSPEDYPIQPKRHTREFLREVAYLRPRTNLFQAVFRIRSLAAFAIHKYFNDRGYVYAHTPILTANDGEGAGEMFQVTTLEIDKIKDGKVDYDKDFFGKKVGLTVTGQLEGETMAMAFKKIYTFGPTFRAEKSNTKTHASEFWMIEPEIAFCDLNELMDIEEDMLKYIIKYVLEHAKYEYEMLDKYVEEGLVKRLTTFVESKAARITHKEAIDLLLASGKKFEFQPVHGQDIAKEHEKYLTEHFDSPVFVKDWPKDIKAFYMKLNDDKETVAAVDLLVPGSGELMGGSQREEDHDKLIARMKEMKVPEEDLWWYLNLRKFGGCYHSGFGMGFERLLMYITGVDNIRDVTLYSRTPGNCEF